MGDMVFHYQNHVGRDQAERHRLPGEDAPLSPWGAELPRTHLGPPFLVQLHRHQRRRALLTHCGVPALPEEVDALLFASRPHRVLSLLATSHCKQNGRRTGQQLTHLRRSKCLAHFPRACEDQWQRDSLRPGAGEKSLAPGGKVGHAQEKREITFLLAPDSELPMGGEKDLRGPLGALRKRPVIRRGRQITPSVQQSNFFKLFGEAR